MKMVTATSRQPQKLRPKTQKMSSKSKSQARLMAAASHNPAFAKKVGIPVSVAKEFNQADKGKKFKQGGETMAKAKLNKLFKGKDTYGEEVKEARAIKSGKITPEEYAKGERMEKAKGYAGGGSVGKSNKAMPEGKDMGTLGLKKGGKCCSKYARGGGIEVRGKTKGRMV